MRTITHTIEDAITALQAGEPILVHDAANREGETDLMYPASAVTPADVARLRNDAGGLVCVALSADIADTFDLPFLHDAIIHPTTSNHDLAYDERSSFSLSVNHRDVRTGITDRDRAHTITAIGRACAAPDGFPFGATFRSPGHVHLLRAANGVLAEREGHTELGIALANAARLPPAIVVCEMLDDETGGARSPADARAYAARHNAPYLEGAQIVEALS